MRWWLRAWISLRRRHPAKDGRPGGRPGTQATAAEPRLLRPLWVWPIAAGILVTVLHVLLFPPLPRVGTVSFPREAEIVQEDVRAPIAFTADLLPRDVELLQIEKVLVEPPVLRRLDPQNQESTLARIDRFALSLRGLAASEDSVSASALARLTSEYPGIDARDIERLFGSPDPARLAQVMPRVARALMSEGLADMLPPGEYSRVVVVDAAGESRRELPSITQQSRAAEVLSAMLREAGLPPTEAVWAASLLRQFITPNLIYDAEATRIKQEAARRSVPTRREFIPGERIIERGDRVTEQDAVFLATLQDVLATQHTRSSVGEQVARAMIRVLLVALILGLYGWLAWTHFRGVLCSPRELAATTVILAVFLLVAAFVLGRPTLGSFAVPVAFVALLITVLLREQAGYATTLLSVSLLALVPATATKDLLVLICLGLVTVVTVRRIQKRSQFYQIIGLLTVMSIALVTLVRTADGFTIPEIGAQYLTAFFTPVLAVAFALFILPLVEPLVGVSSDLTLLELSDLNHPVLQRMALEAPGTYHHSQVVSQLAEQAARAINASALQVRVGALFHDIGKMQKSEYFVENQQPGGRGSKHDELSPSMSALIIASHVKDGIELARRWRLPQVVIDFIPQHHGTQVMEYFYHKALEGEGNETVKVDDYRYPGPKPQRRETAILMLADAVEAATRSLAKPTPSRIKEITKQVCDKRMLSGELDECNLTLADLARIRESFIPLLAGIHHARIVYPGQKDRDTERVPERRSERIPDA